MSNAWLTEQEILDAHRQFGRLSRKMTRIAMGPNWPMEWEYIGIFHDEDLPEYWNNPVDPDQTEPDITIRDTGDELGQVLGEALKGNFHEPDATPAGAVVAEESGATAGETAPKPWTVVDDYVALLEAIDHTLSVHGKMDAGTPLHDRIQRTLALTSGVSDMTKNQTMHHDPEAKAEKIAGLVERYRRGEFSEAVFTASLKTAGMRRDNISALVSQHRGAFTESLPYRRGDVR